MNCGCADSLGTSELRNSGLGFCGVVRARLDSLKHHSLTQDAISDSWLEHFDGGDIYRNSQKIADIHEEATMRQKRHTFRGIDEEVQVAGVVIGTAGDGAKYLYASQLIAFGKRKDFLSMIIQRLRGSIHAVQLPHPQPLHHRNGEGVHARIRLEERRGFEPLMPFGTPVFKTGAINRSTTSPRLLIILLANAREVL